MSLPSQLLFATISEDTHDTVKTAFGMGVAEVKKGHIHRSLGIYECV